MTQRENILAAIPSIPSIPASAASVLRLAQDPDNGVSEIMEAIQYDPALTAEVLRLSNSSYFAGPHRIGSLQQAGVLLGVRNILNLVLTSAIAPLASQELKGYDVAPGRLMMHLMASAIGAQALAKLLECSAPECLFTAALLHDVGKIVLGTFVEVDPGPILSLAEEEGLPFEVAEERVLGINHCEAGALLLSSWNFPEEITDAARWHHDPNQCPGDKTVVDLVHVADLLSVECGFGLGIDGLNYRPSPEVVERLGLTTKLLEQTMCQMLIETERVQSKAPNNGGGH